MDGHTGFTDIMNGHAMNAESSDEEAATAVRTLREEVAALGDELAALRLEIATTNHKLEAAIANTLAPAAVAQTLAPAAMQPPGLQQQQIIPSYSSDSSGFSWVRAATAPWTTPWASSATPTSWAGDVGIPHDGTVDGFDVHNHSAFKRRPEQGRFIIEKDSDYYCNLCRSWATNDHFDGKTHIRKFGNWLHDAKNLFPLEQFQV